VINARSPVSRKFDAENFEEAIEEKKEFLGRKILRSWVTGQRI
jgi:hypothetical protein